MGNKLYKCSSHAPDEYTSPRFPNPNDPFNWLNSYALFRHPAYEEGQECTSPDYQLAKMDNRIKEDPYKQENKLRL
jgi:hypothetical protein